MGLVFLLDRRCIVALSLVFCFWIIRFFDRASVFYCGFQKSTRMAMAPKNGTDFGSFCGTCFSINGTPTGNAFRSGDSLYDGNRADELARNCVAFKR